MNIDYTDLTIVLDRSGSMESVKADTIGGFNAFLKEQAVAPGKATLTLVQFDNEYEVVYAGKPVDQVDPLTGSTFVPRGNTALFDALGRTINAVGARLAVMPEMERPGKVLLVVMTDGEENSSQEFTAETLREMIAHQREKYAWEFVFMGANQDAILAAGRLGIATGHALTYAATPAGTQAAFASLSRNTHAYRAKMAKDMAFNQDDRAAQEIAGENARVSDARDAP